MEKDLQYIDRTEEVQEIIERMPTRMSSIITLFIFGLTVLLITLAWFVKYPDTVTGSIVINSAQPPIRLVCSSPGRLKLIKEENLSLVKEGEYIAMIENAANLKDLLKLERCLKAIDLSMGSLSDANMPKELSLGELNIPYYKFLNVLTQFQNYYTENSYDKQIDALNKMIVQYQEMLDISTAQTAISTKNLAFVKKSFKRDSILFSKRVLSESESDKSHISMLSASDAHQAILKQTMSTVNSLKQAQHELKQINIQKNEKRKQIELDVATSFVDLLDQVKNWEQKYVFKAPVNGKIQYSKFWNNGQFVQAGEVVVSIVPNDHSIVGEMTLPSTGAGKVTIGQKVIIKLQDYPYFEYGSVEGKVSSIALVSNKINTKEGEVETYLISISLPKKLKTNYGSNLAFKSEIKGTGDIITKERRLLERFFDNLRYKSRE
ncbi:HlyD family efflux transporter periplasmic adaptor subunit [Pedobacter deserti]|uniref:HlyD family efflux transporter periplasmic adaptor subunit n=1 Tax=Pedobacter deserti TaxID=2817382 RepID=UPI00210B7EBA|nr:HlyD family efflux transporter periplasmic adaptor subunit [Pedobacter sp. SYSU D00382]